MLDIINGVSFLLMLVCMATAIMEEEIGLATAKHIKVLSERGRQVVGVLLIASTTVWVVSCLAYIELSTWIRLLNIASYLIVFILLYNMYFELKRNREDKEGKLPDGIGKTSLLSNTTILVLVFSAAMCQIIASGLGVWFL